MNESINYSFNLPNSSNNDEIADINKISENFVKLDSVLKEIEDDVGNKDEISVDSFFSSESKNPVQNRVISNGVANSVKLSSSGNPIRLDDVSPLEHEMSVNVDVNGASVQKYGKNLLPYPYDNTTKTLNGITFTDNGDGTITVNGTATSIAEFILSWGLDIPIGSVVTFSGLEGGDFHTYYAKINGLEIYLRNKPETFTVTKAIPSIVFRVSTGITVSNLIFKPQLVLGTTATEYETYKEPTTYTADENGIVKGIIGNGEAMTLIADSGAIISAEYNIDTKKYIDKKFAELAALIVNS